jgi:hypothetical protein
MRHTLTNKISGTVLLTFLTSFAIEVFRTAYSSSGYDGSSLVPWTFEWVWEIAFFILCFLIIKRLQVNYGAVIGFFFVGIFVSSLVWDFYPKSYKVVTPNYYGIEARRTHDTHEEGEYGEQTVYDHELNAGFLYKANDPEIMNSLNEAALDNEYAGTRGFMFWQTGLAYGFIPDLLDEYNGGTTFLNHLELYVTVGPMVLLECLLTGLYTNFITLILLQLIWSAWKRDFIWWYDGKE